MQDTFVAMTWRFKVALPASWDGPVDVIERPWKSTFLFWIFQAFISDGWRYLEAQCRFYKSRSLGGWLVLLDTNRNWIAPPSRQASIGFQDLKFLCFWDHGFDSQGLDVDFFEIYSPRKLTCQWKVTIFDRRYIFKWLGFCRCHLSFCVFDFYFSFDLLRLFCWGWGCPGSNPSSPERTEMSSDRFRNCPGESSGGYHVSP